MWQVYILQSLKDKKFYIGHTSDLGERTKRHNAGRNPSTKYRRPFQLVHSEIYTTKGEAVKREQEIKRYKGGEAFKKLVQVN